MGGAVELTPPPQKLLAKRKIPRPLPHPRRLFGGLQRKWLRLLAGVALQPLRVQINAKLSGAPRAQLVLRQHAEDGLAHNPIGPLRTNPLDGDFLQATGITAMMAVDLLLELVSRQPNLVGVDHHHVIAGIQIRRKRRLVLPNQYPRHSRGQPPQNLVRSVHDKPVVALLELFGLPATRYVSPHPPRNTLPLKDKL